MNAVHLRLRSDAWLWSATWRDPAVRLDDAAGRLTVDGQCFWLRPGGREIRQPAEDLLGPAMEVLCPLGADGLSVEVRLKFLLYEDRGLIALEGEIANPGSEPCSLGDFELLTQGRAELGVSGKELRVYLERSLAHPSVESLVDPEGNGLQVDSQGMVTLAAPSGAAFTVGFVSAPHHRPIVHLRYLPSTDEILLSGLARFNGRLLQPGEQVQTGWLVLRADGDPLSALETYGDLIAAIVPPRQTPALAGWCSWYAIRLPISHPFALANAQVVAERFRDLGMELILLDHGWQVGDLCGDWEPDPQDFPGGLEGLAKDLKELGLKLGLWIAPTEVARSSRLFEEHPEWMLRDGEGRPAITWRWYWLPRPLQSQLDATQEGAYQYIADTFRRLGRTGASYYKLDFMAASADERLYPADPGSVRGWDPLRCAMQAVRDGAGEDAYLRFCQTPPLLSMGLADGVFATTDTLDAGAHTWPTLREVFCMSAAQYWVHGRLYNHDACDLSIRVHGNTEECRLRVALLALSGSSILFSDDLTCLPEERIRLMQQCLPPFPGAARPLNLFTAELPDLWHFPVWHAGLRWDLVALFNFGTEPRSFGVEWQQLGLDPGQSCLVREFWTGEFLGIRSKAISLVVPAQAVRLYSLWPLLDQPQFVGTDLHLSQGLAELGSLAWEEAEGRLSGQLLRAPGIEGHLYVHLPEDWQIRNASHPLRHQSRGLWALGVRFAEKEFDWEIRVEKKKD